MDASLKISLFGPIRVLVENEPMGHVRSRKALWLLALLVLRDGRPAAREWVASALWPDAEGGVALANLRPVVSELRHALGVHGRRLQAPDRNSLVFDLDGAEVDVVRFDRAVKGGDLRQAADLYAGAVLEGCSEEWAHQERNVREAECLSALEALAQKAAEEGEPARAAPLYTRAASLDLWRDAPRRGLMAALAATGDVNAALQAYRDFAHLLSAEAGTAPDRETTALYERLRADLRRPPRRAEAPRPAPNNLFKPLTELIGREDERLDVAARVRRSRLVTLTGMGGVGKTRLALSVASDSLGEHSGGVWFVPLDALTDERTIPQAVAGELGVRERPGSTLASSIAERLGKGRSLLVLDNCEHLVEAVARFAAGMLRDCPDLRVLATSREALGIAGELVWPVPALAFPDSASLPQGRATRLRVLLGYESVRLFVDRAQAVRPAFELDEDNMVAVGEICAQVEGNPLAIELAAARSRAMTLCDVAERLRKHHLDLLAGRRRGLAERQQTLRATLDWSYTLLSPSDRRLLGALSVFAGGWTLDAAEWVCAESSEAAEGLGSLMDKSLVAFDASLGRYRLLETVRQFAAEKLDASGDRAAVEARRSEWCLDFARRAEAELRGPRQGEWSKRLHLEWPNLRESLEQGDRDPTLAVRLASSLWYYWYVQGMRDGRRYLEDALGRPTDDGAARAKALHGLGCFAFIGGDYEAAKGALDASLALRRALGDGPGVAESLGILGNVAYGVEGYERAMELYEESLDLRRRLDHRAGMTILLSNMGDIATPRGEYGRARALYEEGLAIARESQDDRGICKCLYGLGLVACCQGDYPTARESCREAVERYRETGDKRGLAWSLYGHGTVEIHLGRIDAARSEFGECRVIFEEIGDPVGTASATMMMGRAAIDAGDLATAKADIERSLAIFRESDPRVGRGNALCALGTVFDGQGDASAAWACWEEGLEALVQARDRLNVAGALDRLAARAVGALDDGRAARLFGGVEALRERLGAPIPPLDRPAYDRARALCRERSGSDAFEERLGEGRALDWPDVAAYALSRP